MDVYMLLKVLVLRKLLAADVAFEALEADMVNHDVSLQASAVTENFLAVNLLARKWVAFLLALQHFLKLGVELTFLSPCKL